MSKNKDECWLKKLIAALVKTRSEPEPLMTYQEALEQMNKEDRERKK